MNDSHSQTVIVVLCSGAEDTLFLFLPFDCLPSVRCYNFRTSVLTKLDNMESLSMAGNMSLRHL